MRTNRCVRMSRAVLPGLLGLLMLMSAAFVPWAWAEPPPPAPPAPSPAPAPPGPGSGSGPGPAIPALGRAWPVGAHPAVLRGWEPPATLYGRGHRGVDLAAPPGTPVRAVAPGRISYAGRVAGRGVVSLQLSGTDLRTTYEPVRATVTKGEEVDAGDVLGTVEPTGSHCTTSCLHWGLLRGSTYLNPLSLLPPDLLSHGPSRLLPVVGVPLPREVT
ncbi:M23 family metallopeptidase [Streptomyces sp. VMFN-G11Ma]|uniref:M23 family metallopeptidase n=1 Tax=Streptomyces sp. VMFN-G11Ma TaxID=2135609 RepID=UPI000D40FB9E|nr:M23 family metallopeptidase [Streptomyces sp. VMFN-G11Ma]PTM86247.1 peptidase M23-like protein [Streptomyces sp. VMFN-G11Ma]